MEDKTMEVTEETVDGSRNNDVKVVWKLPPDYRGKGYKEKITMPPQRFGWCEDYKI